MKLFEILVPTVYGDTMRPIRTRHHKNWDAMVRKIAGGLTILKPAKGQWVFGDELHEEKVIPVRIACTDAQMLQIVKFSFRHYRQKAIMYYTVSTECNILTEKDLD